MRFLPFLAAAAVAVPPALAQCPPPQSVSPPFTVPLIAGSWSIQHFGQPLIAGQIEFVTISLPAANPVPLSSIPALCAPVGNTPCWYGSDPAVTWFAFGPTTPINTTVTLSWPVQQWIVGLQFVAHFGTVGCVGTGPDTIVMINGQIV